ncbi:MAG: hypothetical protein ACI9Y8_001331 [Candidatus Omnitrophota bacterium]|jgi:hypothetical protein
MCGVVVLVFLSACAVSHQPMIIYQPVLPSKQSNGVKVFVANVIEGRNANVVGKVSQWDAYGKPITILEPQNLKSEIKSSLETELRNSGFVISGAGSDLRVVMSLEHIEASPGDRIESAIKLRCKVYDLGEEVLDHVYSGNAMTPVGPYLKLADLYTKSMSVALGNLIQEFTRDLLSYVES